jgi:hypothetical protein
VAGPRPQRLEAEAMEQVVGRLERADHAELVAEDATDVLAAEGAELPFGGPFNYPQFR